MRRRARPSGWVDLSLQPGVIRHSTVSVGKPDARAVHLALTYGELRVSVEVPDPAELIADLERAIAWRDDPMAE